MYYIEKFNNQFLYVYYKCFSNPQWVKNYGINIMNFNIDEFIKSSVLPIYENVERIIILDKKQNAIGFAHLCFDRNNCVVVGGILPHLLNTGKGINVAIIVYDYLFQQYININSIVVTILESNKPSLKMNSKIGFNKMSEVQSNIDKKYSLVLTREKFINEFTTSLLSRIKYEIQ